MEPQWTWVVRASSSIIQQIPQPPSVKENKRGYCSARASKRARDFPAAKHRLFAYIFLAFHAAHKRKIRSKRGTNMLAAKAKRVGHKEEKIKSSRHFLPREITHFV
jgi:hypothetical protein